MVGDGSIIRISSVMDTLVFEEILYPGNRYGRDPRFYKFHALVARGSFIKNVERNAETAVLISEHIFQSNIIIDEKITLFLSGGAIGAVAVHKAIASV